MLRRTFMKLTGSVAAAALLRPSGASAQQDTVLRYAAADDLTLLDPVTSTAYSTRNHAFMVYDMLFGLDSNFQAHPQMVADQKVSEDGLIWTLKLRDGLQWHDGIEIGLARLQSRARGSKSQ